MLKDKNNLRDRWSWLKETKVNHGGKCEANSFINPSSLTFFSTVYTLVSVQEHCANSTIAPHSRLIIYIAAEGLCHLNVHVVLEQKTADI